MTADYTFLLRGGSPAQWSTVNPVLMLREPGTERDGGVVRMKIGDGVTAWNDLPYMTAVAEDPTAVKIEHAIVESVWDIFYDLPFEPAGVRVFDSAGTEWEGVIEYVALGHLTITFKAPFAGFVLLS